MPKALKNDFLQKFLYLEGFQPSADNSFDVCPPNWIFLCQGASKNGKTPDGTPYIEAAEKDEIKELLT